MRAKFEEWEATVGEDGGYTNLVDEDGNALETASKLKNRYRTWSIMDNSYFRYNGNTSVPFDST